MKSVIALALSVLASAGASAALPAAAPGQNPSNWYTPVARVKAEKALPRLTMEVDVAGGKIPAILLEVLPKYTFKVNESVLLRLTHDPKGLTSAVTVYVYRQNRVTGDRLYYNLPAGGFLPAGEQRDLFSTSSTPVPVNVAKLEDFLLFGPGAALGPAVQIPGDAQPARMQFVFELRDPSGMTIVSRGAAPYSIVSGTETIAGEVTASRTLTADKDYVLNGTVFVRQGATLTVERGTVVYGSVAALSALVIDRGAKIMAEGTATQPVVFTSGVAIGERRRGDWGGIIINGRAPINIPGGTAEGEGNTGTYGGGAAPDPNDNSGVLRYVRVEYAGFRFTQDNELNGIALQGVGRGTVIDHCQVHWNADDGIEFFGGTVNARNILLTNNGDDNLDWVEGWTGDFQFGVIVQNGLVEADTGIEADNKDTNNDLTPRSNPRIYNVTIVGTPTATGSNSNNGVILRRGTAGKIYNSIVTGFRQRQIDIRDASTQTQTANGELVVDNNIFNLNKAYGNGGFGTNADGTFTKTFVETTMKNNRFVDPKLIDPYELLFPNVVPVADSPALDARYIKTPPDNGFFVPVDYLGGVDPADPWIFEGSWTSYSRN